VPDILDEVAEDLRHEQALRLARRYGAWLLAACVVVLVAVGAQQLWQQHEARAAAGAAQQFINITSTVDQPNASPTTAQQTQTAQALSNFAAAAPEGYKTLANLRAAALYASAGQPAQAAALWTGVSQDGAADPLLRDLATLLWAQHGLGVAPDADVLAKLQPLTLDANPYHLLARETQALAYLHQGNNAEAKALLTQIGGDPGATENMRDRAQALLASLNG
jgi:hypothetical protein